MNLNACLAALIVSAACFLPTLALAGPGHDHGEAAPAAAGTALPRFAAVSDVFELVGVLQGQQITLYLDRAADNAPVTGALIELEIAGAQFKAEPQGDTYTVLLAAAPQPGVLPITATVTAGTEVDLLAADLDLPGADHAHEAAGKAAHAPAWRAYASWAAAGLAVLAVLIVIGRRLAARRSGSMGTTGAAA